ITLEHVTQAIEAAQDAADLEAAAEKAAKLTSEGDKAAARKAFAARKKHLTNAVEAGADPSTGEVQGPTFDQVAAQLKAAKSLDTLDIAADLIRDVGDPSHQAELQKILTQRLEELGERA